MTARDRRPPTPGGPLYLTDGGLETTLIFHAGIELPCFAAIGLLAHDEGRAALRAYFKPYLAIARDAGAGFVLDTATWRASPDWGARLGYSPAALDAANRDAVAFAHELRVSSGAAGVLVNGVLGPRGDGYAADELMSAEGAERYHGAQVAAFAGA